MAFRNQALLFHSAQAATYQPTAQAYIQTAQTAYAAARPAAAATYDYQGTQNAYAYRPAVVLRTSDFFLN